MDKAPISKGAHNANEQSQFKQDSEHLPGVEGEVSVLNILLFCFVIQWTWTEDGHQEGGIGHPNQPIGEVSKVTPLWGHTNLETCLSGEDYKPEDARVDQNPLLTLDEGRHLSAL